MADPAKPRLLDLYCGQGGGSRGYTEVGFDVVGVDLHPQPRYRHPFIQGDVLEVLAALIRGKGITASDGRTYYLSDFAVIHASPPCQAYSDLQKQNKRNYPDLIAPTRELLERTGKPYAIENVEGAPLRDPVRICGAGIPGLRVIRHRLFESNVALEGVPCPPKHPLVFTYDKRKAHYGRLDQDTSFVQVTGGGTCTVANKRAAMGTPWMSGHGCNEAIPPAYTEHIGRQLRQRCASAQATLPPITTPEAP